MTWFFKKTRTFKIWTFALQDFILTILIKVMSSWFTSTESFRFYSVVIKNVLSECWSLMWNHFWIKHFQLRSWIYACRCREIILMLMLLMLSYHVFLGKRDSWICKCESKSCWHPKSLYSGLKILINTLLKLLGKIFKNQ